MDSRIKKLFERYESGQANIEERKLVEDWFAVYDSEQQENLKEDKKADSFSQMDRNIHEMLQINKKRKNWLNNYWLQAAAILIMAVNLSWFKFHQSRKIIIQPSFTWVTTPRGIKKEFSLPDGSIVYLNSESAIRIPSNFNLKTREVSLSGEAFFLVKHNASKPFSIHSGKLLITDLGTSFNVKAYPDERRIHIAVESGKVKVEKNNPNGKSEIFADAVTRNQQLLYDKLSNKHDLNQIQINNVTAWRQNKLRFDNASFDEISHTLERWYNVSIRLDHNDGNYRRYTVSFTNEPVSKVLQVLASLSGISYRIDKQNIIINLKNCKKA